MISIVVLKMGDSFESVSIQRKRGDTYMSKFYTKRSTVARMKRLLQNQTPRIDEAQGDYTFKIYEFADAKGANDV